MDKLYRGQVTVVILYMSTSAGISITADLKRKSDEWRETLRESGQKKKSGGKLRKMESKKTVNTGRKWERGNTWLGGC